MAFVSALLLAAQAAPPPIPERDLLGAFRNACARTGDLDAMKADASASGWEKVADDADPRIEKLNRLGREAVAEDGSVTGESFRRTIGGRELFLILSRFDDRSGYWGVGCRLYDFAAAAPVDGATLNAWMGREPTGIVEVAPGISRRLWEPGWREGITVEVTHVPQGHEIAETLGLSGNILVAQAIGGF